MSDINTYNNYPAKSPPIKAKEKNDFVIEAHTSSDMKVKRPIVSANELNSLLPSKPVFSDREATKRMQAINTDIYEGAKKEKEKHEFNLKRFFTIFGIITLLTAAFTYLRRRGKGK